LEQIRVQHDAQIAQLQRSVKVETIIYGALLLKDMGIPYKYGGEWENDKAFDCSSFVQKLFKIAGVTLPRTSKDQALQGTTIAFKDAQRGDLLFFDYSGDGVIDHVAIYLGDGTMIHTNTVATGINIKATGTPKIVKRIL
jgi:cell wall-associated NlpC family hydrolase